MRNRLIVALVALLLLAPGIHAQAPTIGPLEAIGFDYADADVVAFEVNRFEAAYDGGAYAAIGMVVAFAANGVTTYKVVPPQTSGNHTILIKACNAAGCGVASAPFAFAVLNAPAKAPLNIRKIPR